MVGRGWVARCHPPPAILNLFQHPHDKQIKASVDAGLVLARPAGLTLAALLRPAAMVSPAQAAEVVARAEMVAGIRTVQPSQRLPVHRFLPIGI